MRVIQAALAVLWAYICHPCLWERRARQVMRGNFISTRQARAAAGPNANTYTAPAISLDLLWQMALHRDDYLCLPVICDWRHLMVSLFCGDNLNKVDRYARSSDLPLGRWLLLSKEIVRHRSWEPVWFDLVEDGETAFTLEIAIYTIYVWYSAYGKIPFVSFPSSFAPESVAYTCTNVFAPEIIACYNTRNGGTVHVTFCNRESPRLHVLLQPLYPDTARGTIACRKLALS